MLLRETDEINFVLNFVFFRKKRQNFKKSGILDI